MGRLKHGAKLRWFGMLLGLVGLALMQPAEASVPKEEAPRSARLNDIAPDFAAMNTDGVWQAWTNFRGPAGMVVLFADRRTAPCLAPLYDHAPGLAQKGFGMLLIDLSGGKDVSRTEAAYEGLPPGFALRFDPQGDIGRLYGVDRLPSVFVLDEEMILRFAGPLHTRALPLVLKAVEAVSQTRVPENQSSAGTAPPVADRCYRRPFYWRAGPLP